MHCQFDQLCSVNSSGSIEPISNFSLKFCARNKILLVASDCIGIWMLVQVAVEI